MTDVQDMPTFREKSLILSHLYFKLYIITSEVYFTFQGKEMKHLSIKMHYFPRGLLAVILFLGKTITLH